MFKMRPTATTFSPASPQYFFGCTLVLYRTHLLLLEFYKLKVNNCVLTTYISLNSDLVSPLII